MMSINSLNTRHTHMRQRNHATDIHDAHWLLTAMLMGETGSREEVKSEGEPIEGLEISSTASAQPTAIAWHPHKKILAVGWESGGLSLCNAAEKQFQPVQSLHQGRLGLLQWSSQGSRLISADSDGAVVGWKSDGRGSLQNVFHHDLKDPLVQMVFRAVPEPLGAFDLSGLARAAVNGDERALDLFSNWRPKTGGKRQSFSAEMKEHLGCFIGSSSGRIYYVNDQGLCSEVLEADGGIKALLYHEARDLLVVITDSLVLGQFQVDSDGALTEISKVKLSGRPGEAVFTWAGKGLLAMGGGESFLRLWDLDGGDNFVLSLEPPHFRHGAESITCISFSSRKGVLAAGTNHGSVAFWKYNTPMKTPGVQSDPEKDWTPQTPASLSGAIKQLHWGSQKNLLAANVVRDVYILNEQILCAHFKDQTAVVQTSPTQLTVLMEEETRLDLRAKIQVSGVSASKEHLTVWDGKNVVTYELAPLTRSFKYQEPQMTSMPLENAGSFTADCDGLAIFEQTLFLIEDGKVQVRTFQGTVKQTLNFLESEGEPISLDINGTFLTVATLAGVIKIWDFSRREAHPHCHPKVLPDIITDFGEIISAKANCNGTRVAVVIATVGVILHMSDSCETPGLQCSFYDLEQMNLMPDPKLYLWDLDGDAFTYFNFASGCAEEDDNTPPPNSANSSQSREFTALERTKFESAKEVGGRFVLSHFWDPEEPRLLVCEAKRLPQPKNEKLVSSPDLSMSWAPDRPEVIVVPMFASGESGLIVQDSFPLGPDHNRLLGIQTPFFYLLRKMEIVSAKGQLVDERVMRDFVGLETKDKTTRGAMMNFSYFLSIGNMDEAFKAIKAIKSEAVWGNMARMCVKTKRLDVAGVCLGHMGHARGAQALREAQVLPQLDARVAILALQLGMVDEAKRLLKSCGRYDLLNELHQDSGKWDDALQLAASFDRIHLRSTHYNFAKDLESHEISEVVVKGEVAEIISFCDHLLMMPLKCGKIAEAIEHYEASETHRFEVPRMLFDEPSALDNYVVKSKDKTLKKWWAQYLESIGDMDGALQYYEAAEDYFSQVRVHCYCGKTERAAEIANETGNPAACYHLARQYENNDMVRDAIHFYGRAGAYGNAIRICKENNLDDQLLSMALLAAPRDQLEAARYFESAERPSWDKAVLLYHKAGLLSKAVELAFRSQQYSTLQMIALDLDSKADPALLQRVADYFLENNQFDKAVDLLAIAKKYFEALDLCVEHNIPITEELADRLTMDKGEMDEGARARVLEKVAECAFTQGNYHLATKKFTQAGNRVKAMKALLKSGDTEKIVFFANVSRQREIYVMAANYLQSLDWRKDPTIMKNIVAFYTKGKALDLLAGFYVACAQVEIDEYQNYEKGLEALVEAYQAMSKTQGTSPQQVEEKLEQIKLRAELVKKFVDVRRNRIFALVRSVSSLYLDDPNEALKQCRDLLAEDKVELAVRKGDIYGFMVEHYARVGNFKMAYTLIEEMRHKIDNLNLAYYINIETLNSISKALDVPLSTGKAADLMNGKGGSEEDEEEEIEEDTSGEADKPMDPFFPRGTYF
ncbi:unnamed protein product [Darwinula stevensoni]|uniref:Intraflagellar transport protein 140 n=1 Tax=Darwinula stevensoni TaxID=69355 RepID=A0A7R9A989_9CRUS|nr:unnamed protein product [Darwinula stevensoni]CAG0897138.1 unnamed protein product [Darwinula stevensoni]